MLKVEDFIDGVKSSRKHFLKHLEGMREEQLVWKPYPECKNVVETLQHLIIDDKAALSSFKSGEHPDYDSIQVTESDFDKLKDQLAESHQQLVAYLEETYGNGPLEREASAWGTKMPVAKAIAFISSEDYFHAGQVSYIRIATDPTWDYYEAIYS